MDWGVIAANLPVLMRGLGLSFELAGITIALSFPLGCLVAFARISRRPWVAAGAALFMVSDSLIALTAFAGVPSSTLASI